MTQPPPSATFRGPAPIFTLDNPQRQVLTRKLATLLLRPLAANPYRTIVLSGCSFGDAAVNVAGPLLLTLARKQCLHTVILADILASLSADEALRSLSSLASSIGLYKQLVAVDLSHNAIGTRGMAACAPLLQSQPLLQVVNLEDTGLSTDAARLLREYMLSSATASSPPPLPPPASASSTASSPASSTITTTPSTPNMNSSVASSGNSNSAVLTNTSKTTSLQGFNVHGNRLESEGLIHIAAVVERSPQLQCLKASSVGASAPAVTTLARALLRATDLRELDISDNSCDEETATALAAALAQQPRLARLVLADLNMGDSSLAIIIDALLASRAPLAELCLSGNELTAEGARDIVRLLTADHSRLSILDVSINNLGDEGVSIIADAVANTTSQTALAKLNVADNEITSLAAVHLASRLVHSPGVMELDFSQNEDVSPAVSKRIAAIFPPTVVVLEDDDDNDYRSNPQTGDGNEEDDADAETDVGDDPVDEDDTRQAYQQSRSAQQVESALQALEKSVRSERGETVEPASPRSQSEVSRLVNFFSDPDDKMKTDNEIGNGTGITNDEAASSSIANVGATTHGTTTATSTSDAEHRVPATPPPSRFLSGITSPITPPPSSSSVHTRGQAASSSGQTVEGDNMDAVNDDDVDMEGVGVGEGDDYGDGDGEGDDGNVILSARKLKESIVSLSKEISDVAGELELPVSPSLQPRNLDPGIMAAGDDANGENDPFILRRDDNATAARTATASASMVATANQALVITAAGAAARSKALATDVRPKMSPVTIAVDCAGGCLVALFVIVIVLAIAQSQEESTFSFRPL